MGNDYNNQDNIDWNELFGSDDSSDEYDNDNSNTKLNIKTWSLIPGLVLAKEAISHEAQMKLLQAITDNRYFHDDIDQAICFGTLPKHFSWLETWAKTKGSELFPSVITSRRPLFDQAFINLYPKGKGIKSHVDLLRFDDGILSISLLSSCVMMMKKDNQKIPVVLRPGDVLALSGEARYQWEHGIEEKTSDQVDGEWIERGTRVSITLRKMVQTLNFE
ncbi:hypothetical protein INT45_003724 [Circinella minor]|uniref:Fe2OG dioxygenase domain-containing protein n=1 Tax=Circinella minor TaxID=1195481 RepID=A0A8H7S8B0_9FUNG|nr:hypothetical protein INT45_003724 [Circinella minor]